MLAAILRASSAVRIQLLLFGLGRQKRNNYASLLSFSPPQSACCREQPLLGAELIKP